MKKQAFLLLVLGLGIGSSATFAQCDGFIKRKCAPVLVPYINNGKSHKTVLESGDKARVNLNLNKGLSYRIIICAESTLNGLSYTVENNAGRVFKKEVLTSLTGITDLRVKQTGEYVINIQVPETKNAASAEKGCVSVLIGFKE